MKKIEPDRKQIQQNYKDYEVVLGEVKKKDSKEWTKIFEKNGEKKNLKKYIFQNRDLVLIRALKINAFIQRGHISL